MDRQTVVGIDVCRVILDIVDQKSTYPSYGIIKISIEIGNFAYGLVEREQVLKLRAEYPCEN